MCAAIVFLGDQPPMPREQGFGSNQRRDVLQHAATQRLGLLRKSPPLIVSEAIVLHAFDYLESSRIVRLVTRDAGMRSGIAKGARKSRRRFGSGLDLFAQGTAFLHTKPGRELDMLSGFEDVRTRTDLASDLERFSGAETIAEIALHFGREGADADLFDAIADAFDALTAQSTRDAREVTLGGAWRIVATLGFGPAINECAECDSPIAADQSALFSHSAGGVLCKRCASLKSLACRSSS